MSSYQSHIAMLLFKQQKRMLLAHQNNTQLMRKIFEKGTQFSPLPAYFKAKKNDICGRTNHANRKFMP